MVTIQSIELSKLNSIHNDFTQELLDNLCATFPTYINDYGTYWLINNTLTITSQQYMQHIHLFNVLLHISRNKCNFIQITKNKQ